MNPSSFRRGLLFAGSGSAANLLFLFLETIVVARLLSTDDYGGYLLLLTGVNFILMAADFGAKSTVTQVIASADPARRAAATSSALAFRAVVLVFASLLVFFVQAALWEVMPDQPMVAYLSYAPMMVAVASLDELLFAVLQGFQRYRTMAVAQVGRGALRVGLTLFFLIGLDAGVMSLVYSWTISFGLSTLYQFAALPAGRAWGWDWSLLREMLRFGMPLQATRVLWFAAGRVHIVLLGALAGPGGVAFFGVAARIPDALQTMAEAYIRVYFPTVTTLLAEGRRRQASDMLNQSVRLVSFGLGAAAVAAVAFSQEIVTLVFSAKYAEASGAFGLLVVATHMTTVVNVMGYTLTAAGEPRRALGVDAVRTGLSCLGDLVLIPPLGVLGSAVAAVVASYGGAPFASRWVRRSNIDLAMRPYLTQTSLVLGCAGAAWFLGSTGSGFRAATVLAFVGLSFLTGSVTRADLGIVLPQRGPRPAPALALGE